MKLIKEFRSRLIQACIAANKEFAETLKDRKVRLNGSEQTLVNLLVCQDGMHTSTCECIATVVDEILREHHKPAHIRFAFNQRILPMRIAVPLFTVFANSTDKGKVTPSAANHFMCVGTCPHDPTYSQVIRMNFADIHNIRWNEGLSLATPADISEVISSYTYSNCDAFVINGLCSKLTGLEIFNLFEALGAVKLPKK